MSGVRSTFVVIDVFDNIVVVVHVDVPFNYFLQVCGGTCSAVETFRQLCPVPTNAEEARHSHQLPSIDCNQYPCLCLFEQNCSCLKKKAELVVPEQLEVSESEV